MIMRRRNPRDSTGGILLGIGLAGLGYFAFKRIGGTWADLQALATPQGILNLQSGLPASANPDAPRWGTPNFQS